MSQRQGQTLKSLADLGAVWKARLLADCEHPRTALVTKGSDTRCGICGRSLAWFEVADLPDRPRRPEQSRGVTPGGDLAPCACGKRSHPTEAAAARQAAAFGNHSRPYSCPLGLPVWHLKTKGPSRRDRTGT